MRHLFSAEAICSLYGFIWRACSRTIYTSGAADAPTIEDRMRDLQASTAPCPSLYLLSRRCLMLQRDVALHYVLPRTSITPLLNQGLLSAQEVAYAYAVRVIVSCDLLRSI